MASGYWIVVLGPRAEALGTAELLCETAREACVFAFSTSSPFGHELWSETGFLGRFDRALSNEQDTPTLG
jgi:hypothetical protein